MSSPRTNGAGAPPVTGDRSGLGAGAGAPVAIRDSGPHAGYPRVTQASRRLVNRFCDRLEAAADEYDEEARRKIVAAARWSNARHSGQFRASGDPFIIHPLEVASILLDTRLDTATLVAALLHDVVEDTGSTVEEITATFGEEVAELVQGVTKISIIKGQSHWARAAESIRKMLFAMVRDVRVILISWPTSSTTCARWSSSTPRIVPVSHASAWTSTVPWRDGWACTGSAPSWRTWR